MKKYLIIFLLIVIFGAGIYLLNTFEVISVRAWGEKAITSTPFLKEYVQTDTAYEDLFAKWQNLQENADRLSTENEELQKLLEERENTVVEQADRIDKLEAEMASLEEEKMSEAERLDKLVRIYSEMDPEEAADIFGALDRDLALTLLKNLKEDQTAAILTNLSSEEAAAFSSDLR